MNEERWLFIGTDARFSICEKYLRKEGKTCKLIQTNQWTAALDEKLIEFQPSHIVCPMNELEGHIPIHLLAQKPVLYVGNASEEWRIPYEEAGVTVYCYLQEESFVWENAHLTAEAFLQEFYKETARVVRNTSFHVAGFGRVGKMIARLLKGIGGNVTIIAQTDAQLAEAKMFGYHSHALDRPCVYSDSYVVNTIPAKWFEDGEHNPLFVFDLASAPGCLVNRGNVEYYTILPGLPGKHFPIEAALALKDVLNRLK